MNQPNPYAAPSSVIEDDTGFDPDPWGGAPIAERGTRLGAKIIDGIIGGVCVGIGMVLFFLLFSSTGSTGSEGLIYLAVIVSLLPLMAYNAYLLHKNGQTIGKRILKIKIVRSDRQTPASLGRIIGLRIVPLFIAGLVPILGNFAGLIDALFIFSEDQQCIHDMIADTIVVVDDHAYGGSDFDAGPSSGPGLYGGDNFGSTGTDGSSGGGRFGPGGDSGGSAGGPASNDNVAW